jgi:hypothetical protein
MRRLALGARAMFDCQRADDQVLSQQSALGFSARTILAQLGTMPPGQGPRSGTNLPRKQQHCFSPGASDRAETGVGLAEVAA